MFGPEYPKIQTIFKRDPVDHVIIPFDYTTDEFAYLQHSPWEWTEKIDGTNIRLHFDGSTITVGGRTDNAQIPTSLIKAFQPHLDVDRWKAVFEDETDESPQQLDVTLYGEGYGPGIQKGGGLYRDTQDFILFDVKVGNWWLKRDAVYDVASKLGLGVVPNYGTMTLVEAVNLVRSGFMQSAFPKVGRRIEGLVGRPTVDLFNRRGRRIITKIKVKDFTDLLDLAERVGRES